jgi:hypothetical protein
MKTYTIWTTAPHTGDLRDALMQYTNRGHALAKLRGLRRAAWRAGSEINYTLRD